MIAGHLRVLNKRYHVVLTWMENGKQKQKSFSTKIKITDEKAKTRAKEILAKAKEEFDPQSVKLSKNGNQIFLHDYARLALENHALRQSLSLNSKVAIKVRLKVFKKVVKNIPLKELNQFFIENTLLEVIKEYSQYKSYYTQIRIVFSLLCQEAYKDQLIPINFMFLLPKFNKKNNPTKKNILTKEELAIFLEAVKDHPCEFEFLMALFLGLRSGELLNLQYPLSFNMDESLVYIKSQACFLPDENGVYKIYVNQPLKTENSNRIIFLPDFLKDIIKKRLKQIKENKKYLGNFYNNEYNSFLCVNNRGILKTTLSLDAYLRTLCKKNNLPHLSMHSLRHNSSTLLYLEDVDLKDIQFFLGHKSLKITSDIYVRDDISKIKRIAKKFNFIYEKIIDKNK